MLDPAIKKLFIEKDQDLILIIPIAIIISFATKGISLYFAKTILVGVAEEVKKILQFEMLSSFIKADTQYIDTRHSGKSISNLNFDVEQIKNLLSRAFLNLIDTINCVKIAANNQPKKGEFRVFNQFTEFSSLNEMANKIKLFADKNKIKAEIKHVTNPRIEEEGHYYNPKNTSLISEVRPDSICTPSTIST